MTFLNNYGSAPPEWPFPIRYGVENRIEADVLVVGAGIAGGMAAIAAVKRGAKVAVVDKSPIAISGCGGAGLDHYLECFSNPDSPYSPEEVMKMPEATMGVNDHKKYIQGKLSWENLMLWEELGVKIRDEDNDFAGAPFIDEKTKLMYAYDYKNKVNIRIRGGYYIKRAIYNWLTRQKNVSLHERVMITKLLTKDGKAGMAIAGATGINSENGEFYIFNAKAVVISSGGSSDQTWVYNTDNGGSQSRYDPNNTGDGFAMAWEAGAQFNGTEQFGSSGSGSSNAFAFPSYGVGYADNTWMPCNIVDNNGKEIPWEDSFGKPISDLEDRTLPAEGQAFISFKERPGVTRTLPERIRNGEFEQPLWADISSLPEYERRGIWGLMVSNEGKTRYPVYDYYNKAGFNPDTDMLQVPIHIPENYIRMKKEWSMLQEGAAKIWKGYPLNGVAVDWDHMTTIPGLFAAGHDCSQNGATVGGSGIYAGNRAVEYARANELVKIDETQVSVEKERVYAPVIRAGDPKATVGWKEFWGGLTRVMQQDLGEYKTIAVCEHGLMWLDSIRKQEARMTFARNPHELVRVLECESRLVVDEIYFHSCIAKLKADAKSEGKGNAMFIQWRDGKTVTTYRENEWWLKAPYAPTYLENYEKHTALEREG